MASAVPESNGPRSSLPPSASLHCTDSGFALINHFTDIDTGA
jgi:hypothetical protein